MNRAWWVVVWVFSGSAFAGPAASAVPPLPPLEGLSSAGVPVVASSSSSSARSAPAAPAAPLAHVRNGSFDLRYVTVGQLVDLLYGDALHVPHVINSDVLQDGRLVSFQYHGAGEDLRAFVKVFLDSQGFQVVTRDGVDFVSRKPPSALPPAPAVSTYVYRPRYRTAQYLTGLVQPLFSGRVKASEASGDVLMPRESLQGPVGASDALAGRSPMLPSARLPVARSSGAVSTVADDLVFSGTADEIAAVKQVLPQIDTAPGEVVVRGWVYEVATTNDQNSAFSIAAKVLKGIGGQLSFSNGSTDQDASALRFTSSYLNVAISALNADSRFKQVSDPHVRVVSGADVRLNVGSQVPTLGSISYQGVSGTPVQSVEYQDAGLIFDVQPTVMERAIQVKLQEQMSNFVATTTGVNNSPTKNTRQMSTTLSMQDGEVVVIGGLVQDTGAASHTSVRWLPHLLDGHSASGGRTEVLLVLQVEKV